MYIYTVYVHVNSKSDPMSRYRYFEFIIRYIQGQKFGIDMIYRRAVNCSLYSDFRRVIKSSPKVIFKRVMVSDSSRLISMTVYCKA